MYVRTVHEPGAFTSQTDLKLGARPHAMVYTVMVHPHSGGGGPPDGRGLVLHSGLLRLSEAFTRNKFCLCL